jgi:hypothetical protein
MADKTDFEKVVDHVMSDDDSELGKTRAERDYALHCLERELAICAKTQARCDALEDVLRRIYDWSRAYPIAVFPEPDWKRAAELLKAGGIGLDAISASNMRVVIKGVGEIAKEALKPC